MTTLYKHQQDFLAQNPNKSTLVWSCGTGKTRTAIEWALKTPGSHNIHAVICPKALATNWERECKRWSGEDVIFRVYTKEQFRKMAKEFPVYDSIIVDEVHNGFLTPNFKSAMSKALRGYLKKHNVPRVLLLSATVYTSSPWNIYNLAYYTGHIWNYQEFKYKYFTEIRMGMRWIPVAKKGIERQLSDEVKKIASVVDIHDVLDVPLQNHLEPEYFALSKEQQKAIKDNYDPLPIVRYTAQHEIENGILIGNEFREDEEFYTDKTERILDVVKETKKLAVICRYNKQIDILQSVIRDQNPEKKIGILRGDVVDRDYVTRMADEVDDIVVLIQADCAEGYQLPSFELCIFASMSYSYTKWEQICGRFLRMDKPSRTTFMYLLTEGDSIDQAVYDAVKRKEDFKIQLYAN